MKRVGRVLFLLGILGMITSGVIMFNTCNAMTNMDDPERAGFAGAVLLAGFIPCMVVTIVGWLLRRLGEPL